MKKLSALLCLILILLPLCLPSCGDGGADSDALPDRVLITVKDYGRIVVELDPAAAPLTVANFKKLVAENYYAGTTFHRIINGFMIQGGKGKQTSTVKGEFSANGIDNPIKHERGVISMARAAKYDSASSQFFICHTTERCAHLDGNYAAFGRVIEGMEVVDRIAAVQTGANDAPLSPVVIESILFYGSAEAKRYGG